MKVKPNQDFLDEGKRFTKGRTYDVSEERAFYFTTNGWLEGTEAPPRDVVLEIHDGDHGQEARF